MTVFYSQVNSYWTAHRSGQLAHVTLVSLGGGARDLQVRASLTQGRRELPGSHVVPNVAQCTPMSEKIVTGRMAISKTFLLMTVTIPIF